MIKALAQEYPPWTTLVDEELEWARYQPFLEEHGYMLRRRYRPGWIPEMVTTKKKPYECEDSIPSWVRLRSCLLSLVI
jgi:hypothetical protein